jgi:NDP-hexose 2,3-enoyl reductase
VQYTTLGRTGLVVSRLCLGTMEFGPTVGEKDSQLVMDAALDEGINFFDTANVYGRKLGEGVTESIIGRWFGRGGGRRDRVVLATKVYGKMADWPNGEGLSARTIIAEAERSLRRLGTDYIDLYQMHHIDRRTPWEEIWQAMETLVSQGKVRYVGSSNFAGWHLARAQAVAERRQFLGLVSEQCLYNLMARTVELEVLPAAEGHGLGVLPWSPLNGGLLGGVIAKSTAGEPLDIREHRRAVLETSRPSLAAFETLCDELGHKPAQVAVAWLLAQPVVTAPVVGPLSVEHLRSALGAFSVKPNTAVLERLGELFPPVGNGGPGPEAWAW